MRTKERVSLWRTGLCGLVGAVVCLGSAAFAQDDAEGDAAKGGHGGRPATSVRAVRVELRDLQDRRRVTGELRAIKRSRVATKEPGLVVDLPVEEGEIVKVGDVVAVLDSRRLAINLRRLESRLAAGASSITASEAELALEKSDVDALRALSAQRATNPKELADAESAVLVASAGLDRSRSELEVIRAEADLERVRLEDMTIRAPIDGVVVATNTERGEWVAEGDPIVEIVSVGRYDAWLDVPQRYAPSVLGRHEPVQVVVDATGFKTKPQLPVIVPQVDKAARTFRVYVGVDDAENVLAPGMSVSGWVPTGARANYLTVPRDALLRNQAGFFVYVARGGPDGPKMATPVPITLAFEYEANVAVASGALREGDLVVVEGNERLFPMMPIAPIVSEPPPSDAKSRTSGAPSREGGI